jgi:uncharacterized protein with GYD domain
VPKYLVQFTYTTEAWKTMTQNPQDRTPVISALCEKLGGKMEALYYSFGEHDGLVLADLPDNQAATAVVLAAVSPGHIKSIQTTVLLTAQELMEAQQKAKGVTYQGPRG